MIVNENYITIFIPTYNRVKYLPRLFNSLEKQTVKNFDVLIIDDGSTDNTEQFVKEIIKKSTFTVTYYKKENGRKASAYNYAIPLIKSTLTLELDSDDYLTSNALEVIEKQWKIYFRENNKMIAMRFLAKNHLNETVIGNKFPNNLKYSSLYDLMFKYKIKGDKTLVFLTENLKKYQFPSVPFENVRMSILYNRLCQGGGVVGCHNKAIMIKEYLVDGITSHIKKETKGQLFKYPVSNAIFFNELNYCTLSIKDYIKHNAQYVKFELANGKSFSEIKKGIINKRYFLFSVVYLLGYVKYKKRILN